MALFPEHRDFQPTYADEVVGGEPSFNGLIASGWFTAAVCIATVAENVLAS